MVHDPHVRQWQRLRSARMAHTVQHVQRLRTERVTRSAGAFYGTRATAYGDVPSRPHLYDAGQSLLALMLLAVIVATASVALDAVGHDVLGWVPYVIQPRTGTVTIDVRSGQSVDAVAAVLQRHGLVTNATIFAWYWYLRPSSIRGSERMATGVHVLHTGMTMEEVAQALLNRRLAR